MITVIGMLLAFWSGFLVARYANKPMYEIPLVSTIYEHVEAIKEYVKAKKMTLEEYEEQSKVNTFYD